jgi:hypothetical protein
LGKILACLNNHIWLSFSYGVAFTIYQVLPFSVFYNQYCVKKIPKFLENTAFYKSLTSYYMNFDCREPDDERSGADKPMVIQNIFSHVTNDQGRAISSNKL